MIVSDKDSMVKITILDNNIVFVKYIGFFYLNYEIGFGTNFSDDMNKLAIF